MGDVTTTLYRFWDASGALLYVGITGVGTVRWFAHAAEKGWWTKVASVTLEHFEDRGAAIEAEARAILVEHPQYNVIGLRPSPVRKVGAYRKYGTGSVFFRKNRGVWRAKLPPDEYGKTRTRHFPTRAEAEQFLAAALELEAA